MASPSEFNQGAAPRSLGRDTAAHKPATTPLTSSPRGATKPYQKVVGEIVIPARDDAPEPDYGEYGGGGGGGGGSSSDGSIGGGYGAKRKPARRTRSGGSGAGSVGDGGGGGRRGSGRVSIEAQLAARDRWLEERRAKLQQQLQVSGGGAAAERGTAAAAFSPQDARAPSPPLPAEEAFEQPGGGDDGEWGEHWQQQGAEGQEPWGHQHHGGGGAPLNQAAAADFASWDRQPHAVAAGDAVHPAADDDSWEPKQQTQQRGSQPQQQRQAGGDDAWGGWGEPQPQQEQQHHHHHPYQQPAHHRARAGGEPTELLDDLRQLQLRHQHSGHHRNQRDWSGAADAAGDDSWDRPAPAAGGASPRDRRFNEASWCGRHEEHAYEQHQHQQAWQPATPAATSAAAQDAAWPSRGAKPQQNQAQQPLLAAGSGGAVRGGELEAALAASEAALRTERAARAAAEARAAALAGALADAQAAHEQLLSEMAAYVGLMPTPTGAGAAGGAGAGPATAAGPPNPSFLARQEQPQQHPVSMPQLSADEVARALWLLNQR